MKTTFYISIFFLALTSCGLKTSDKNTVGICCDKTYTNIDSALKCFSRTSTNPTGYDERLLLIAFVTKDLKANQDLGWNIINDPEIISVAKKKYLLITLDINQISLLDESCFVGIHDLIKKNKDETTFVISSGLCPFRFWSLSEKKGAIISDLELGNGP